MFKFGTIILVPFPFTDLTSTKLRPALIISANKKDARDVILCFITSQIASKENSNHFVMTRNDHYFQFTGLKTDSCFRFDKLATLNKKLLLGELGIVHPTVLKKMKKSLLAAFGF